MSACTESKGTQIGYKGHVINFPQDVKEFASQLPHRIQDLTSVIAVRMKKDELTDYQDFHVRALNVKNALLWLQINNEFYSDILVSEENLSLLPEDGNMFEELSLTEDIITISEDELHDQVCLN